MKVQRLSADDWQTVRALRLAALKTDPTSFATSYEVSRMMAETEWRDMMVARQYFAALDDDEPIGLAALRLDDGESFRHRAVVLNLYVDPIARGKGVGTLLLTHLAEVALAQGILQLELGVNAESKGAIRLYEKNGYTVIGTMPRGFRVQNRFFDEVHMVRLLDRS